MQKPKIARNACHPCYSQKRKCDRLIPICSRCTKNSSQCHYAENVAWRSLENYANTGYLPEAPTPGLWATLPMPDPRVSPLDDREIGAYPTTVTSSILSSCGVPPETVIECYLVSVHPWLPIVNPIALRRSITAEGTTRCTGLVFIIYILLIIPPIFPVANCKGLQLVLYTECKSLFKLLQSSRRERLTTVQTGVLLALYEQGNGDLARASQTLSTCADMGYEMGLHEQYPWGELFLQEERCRVWCAIYILDRLLSLDDSGDRTNVVREARPCDVPPVGDELWGCGTSDFRPFPAVVSLPCALGGRFSCFALQVQAATLLDQAQRCTSKSSQAVIPKSEWDLEFCSLDRSIRKGICDLINNTRCDWECSYRSVVILLLAMVELHQTRLALLCDTAENDSLRKNSALAINMAVRLTVDIVSMDDILKVERMPLTAVILLQKAASVTKLGTLPHEFEEVSMRAMLGSLERASWRWKVAGHIATHLRSDDYIFNN